VTPRTSSAATKRKGSAELFPGQALLRRLLFPVRPYIHVLPAALPALHPRTGPRHFRLCWTVETSISAECLHASLRQ
jgi:hypothetical protein